MVTARAQLNPSTGLASWSASGLMQGVGEGFMLNDHCCFLDPDPDIWSSVVTYAKDDEVGFSAGSVVYRSLVSNNLNNTPSAFSPFWVKSTQSSCNNTGWDSYPPYGGVGKTPEFYEMTIIDMPAIVLGGSNGTIIPSVVNATHVLEQVRPQEIFEESWHSEIQNATTTGKDLDIFVKPLPLYKSVSMELVFGFSIDPCEIFGSKIITDEPTNYTVEWNPK
jgi:hypothetical protein